MTVQLGQESFLGPPISETPILEKPLLGTVLGPAVTVQVLLWGQYAAASGLGRRCGAGSQE